MTQQYESISSQQISDLVQLTVKLARSIRKSDPALYGVAVDFLKRNSLLGSPLREDEPACTTDVCKAASSDGVLCAEGDCDQSSGVRPPMRHIPGVREDVLERAAKAWSNSVVEVRGLYYKNVNVPLTGYRFVECRFDNCTFSGTAEGRQFELCIFDRGLVADSSTELPGWPQVELDPYQILSIERRSSMTDDEALRFGRAVESRILANMKIRPNPPGVAVSDTLPLEKALHELVDKIVPGLDTGDLVQDARQASAALDSVMVSAPVAGYIAGIDAFRTGVGETSATFKTTAFGAPVADERAALEWYAEHVAGCRKLGPDGDAARQALDKDGGERARAALASAPSAGQQPIVHQHGFAADNQRLRAINESLDKQLEEVMTERDNREDVIDKLLDIVLGADRSEWSSEYGYGHAVIEVEERMHALASAPVAGEAKNYPGDNVAERLDKMADGQPPGSQAQSDLYAAATIWRKHIAHRAAPQASAALRTFSALEEAAHLMEQTGKRIAASDIRALKTQADKDGGGDA